MVHMVALQLRLLFSHPEEGHGFPSCGHQYCQVQPPAAPGVSKENIWCVFTVLGSSFLAACFKTVHFADTQPLIALPPSPMSPSPIQTSSAAPRLSIAKLIVHRRVCITIFHFPFVQLADITLRFAH